VYPRDIVQVLKKAILLYNLNVTGIFIKKANFFIVIFFVFFESLLPQAFSTRNYSKKDGLPGTSVWCFCQDSKGYLWVGTNKGLCRFDGFIFQPVSSGGLTDTVIRDICEDREGNLWIGTLGKGVKCLPDADMERVTCPGGLSNGYVYSIVQDADDHLWFGTGRSLLRFDGNTLKTYISQHGLPGSGVSKIAVDREKRVWAASNNGICYFKEERFESFDIPEDFRDSGFFTILPDTGGRLWIGTPNGLICGKNGVFTSYTVQDGLNDNRVTSLYEDADGNTWIGTWSGLNMFSHKDKTFISITTENGLPHNFIYSIFQDREGNIWVGTHAGVSRLRSVNIVTYAKRDGLAHDVVYDIIQDRTGRYWLGTADGLSCFADKKFKTYTTEDGLVSNSIYALLEDRQGKIWIGTLGGLVCFFSGRFNTFNQIRDIIYELKESRDGTVWIGGSRGIYRVQKGIRRPLPFKDSPLDVSFILEDSRGNLWFASRKKGLYNYSPTNKTLTHFNSGIRTLVDNHVRAIFEDSRGSVWIGSEGGLSRYHNGLFSHYSSKDGLPHNTCNVILEDHCGHIWIGTENGLAVFDGKTFKTYTAVRHGLATDYWNIGLKDRQGDFWLGGQEGVTRFTPPPLKTNTVPPPIYITGVNVLEKEVPLAQLGQLTHRQNYIHFQFVGLCFSAPKSVVYRYKLDAIDSRWRETQNPLVSYPYLPPGSYRFRVKAVNNDGIESSAPAEVSFEILPPFWRTWWFGLLVLLIAISIVSLLVVWRYNRAREKAELAARNRQLVMAQRMELMGSLAAGTVHDLKNLLSIILGYTRMMSRKSDRGGEGYQHLETIKDTAATAVQMSKQILSLARYPDDLPGKVELGELLEEILKTLEITLPKKIKTQWKLPDEPVRFAIHPARFQQVVINLCQNAAHAMPDGGELTVMLSNSRDNEIQLQVSDTGIGIEANVLAKIFNPLFTTKKNGKGTGLGLFVVKQIVNEYNGTIEVISERGKGTTFTILFPAAG
jgi:ligand-binding sensor domain-containing protein/signal transduction histidine kinase